MRKGTLAVLALVFLVAFAAGCANAWVRARMFDGYTPSGPQFPFAGRTDGWSISTNNDTEEFRAGELNGPPDDQRITWRMALSNTQFCKGDVVVPVPTNDQITSALWSGCIGTRTGSNPPSDRAPAIRIRLDATDTVPNAGSVTIAYNNDSSGGKLRGWACTEGTRTAGGVELYQKDGLPVYGVAIDHGIWHKVRLTVDPVNGTWDFWVNDGTSLTDHMTGTLGPDVDDVNRIDWGAPSKTQNAEFYTECFYWGQGVGEIDPIPASGEQYDIGGVGVTAGGNSATVTWVTENASTQVNRVYYGNTFHTLTSYVDAVRNGDHWEAQLDDLDWNTAYTFYCESLDSTGQAYDTGLYSFRTDEIVLPNITNPGFESGCDIYPWVDVFPPDSGDTQRWGRVYRDIDYEWNHKPYWKLEPKSGMAFAGAKLMNTTMRKYATVRQKVAVTPGMWYRATMQFEAFGNSAYQLGRIMLDHNGDDAPGSLLGGVFALDDDVWYADCGGGGIGEYRTVQVYAKAVAPVMSLFLQTDYDATAGPLTYLAVDDAAFEPSPVTPPAACGQAKAEGEVYGPVELQDVVVTARRALVNGTSVIGYVEDDSRDAGIRVECRPWIWDGGLDIGARVDVTGLLVVNPDNEVYVRAMFVTGTEPTETLRPVAMTNKSLGGGPSGLQVGLEKGFGLNNVGLLVTTSGRVTAVGPPDGWGNFSVFIDDGSGLVAGESGSTTTHPGIEVDIPFESLVDPGLFVAGRTYLAVTGSCSVKLWDPDGSSAMNNSLHKRVVRIRSESDIVYVIP